MNITIKSLKPVNSKPRDEELIGHSIWTEDSDYYLRKFYLETEFGIPNHGTCYSSIHSILDTEESDYYLRKIYLETQLGIPNYGTCGPSTSLNLHTFDVQNTVYPFLKKAK